MDFCFCISASHLLPFAQRVAKNRVTTPHTQQKEKEKLDKERLSKDNMTKEEESQQDKEKDTLFVTSVDNKVTP